MTPHDAIHPDLLALVHEAADERASRVLISLATSGRKAGEPSTPSGGKTSIEKLEAKLIESFHEELADLYWHVGERMIYTVLDTAKYLSPAQRVHRDSDIFGEEPWKARANELLSASPSFRHQAQRHVERLARIVQGHPVPLLEVARAAYDLVPLADYRLHEAWAHEANGNLAAAKKLLRDTLELPYCDDDHGRAFNNLGHIAGIEEDLEEEFACYEQASKLVPREGSTIFYWARLALSSGTASQMCGALDQVESLAQDAPASFAECLRSLRAEALASAPLAPSVPRPVREHAGPLAAQFLELLS